MDINQIQELIRLVSKAKLAEFILKEGDFKLIIRNQPGPESAVTATPVVIPAAPPLVAMAPAAVPPPAQPEAQAPPPSPDSEANLLTIKSPMIGTFYRSPGPDKAPFVKVGDRVDTGATVCIIEAMKLFNEIESDVKGKIVKVLVEDASPVEYDQPLFLVDPA
ncbi:MAG: acetyl-CoA carboxylase biotin carboxyl carrier protein [Saprospirales bacterium]|nr:acetyl-CoA carboxylase biotin carboxyl carrier protein [Saprospirales bacterium]